MNKPSTCTADATRGADPAEPVVTLLLPIRAAAAAYGVGLTRFQELVASGIAPAPKVLGTRSLRWSVKDLQAAIEKMPSKVERVEPESLLRARINRLKQGASAPAEPTATA